MFDSITVRMYEMGFGDCFLVAFNNREGSKFVLFDCGSLSRTKAEIAKVAQHVVSTCSGENGKARIELVVCTHRHKDHVSGFDNDLWGAVEVGEVWMPWTEDLKDPDATRIRERQSKFALALCRSLDANAESSEPPLTLEGKDQKSSTLALALNALTNEKAMSTLHEGFAGRPKRYFLPSKKRSTEPRNLAGLPGVKFHILGPSRLESVIKAMEPPKDGAYLSTSPPNGQGIAAKLSGACDAKWRVEPGAFDAAYLSSFNENDRRKIDQLAEEPGGELAAAIDQAVNNTSLVMMIEVGGQFLLFPGDAQWGTWKAILDDHDHRALLARTTMLKVSHHGSHNGTPKELVEHILSKGTVSLVSTELVKQWPDVPRLPLLKALSEKTILARSDQPAKLKKRKNPFTIKDGYIEWQTAVTH